MPDLLPPCRHRGEATSAGTYSCRSPKLVGLKLVTGETCSACYCRDHDGPPPARTAPPRLLPCRHLAALEDDGDLAAVHDCSHPRHGRTTLARCRECPDYLFPFLTPHTPVEVVRQTIDLPPCPQPARWWEWENVQQAYREAATEEVSRLTPWPGQQRERGIVLVGGGRYFASVYVTIRVLRQVGCRLPIQVWHLAGEMTQRMADLLRPFEVECVDIDRTAQTKPFRFLEGHWWKGWQLKPYALVHCPFREVLLLDADCYPVRNPEYLFDWQGYRQYGAVFWPDCLSSEGLLRTEVWSTFGLEPGGPPLESGQLLVDRGRCWDELQLTLWYNAHADFVYHILWGDKDTFNVAWHQLGRAYALPWPHCDFDTHTILQYGPDGNVLFQHRCRDKFRLGNEAYEGTPQFYAGNQFNDRLAHEALCFSFLEELRRCWRPGE